MAADRFLQKTLTRVMEQLLFPGLNRFLPIGGETTYTLGATYDTATHGLFCTLNGNEYPATWVNGTTVQPTFPRPVRMGDVVHIMVVPGMGAGYASLNGASMGGVLDMLGNAINGIPDAENDDQPVSLAQIRSLVADLGQLSSLYWRLNGSNHPSANMPMAGRVFTGMPVDAINLADDSIDDQSISVGQVRALINDTVANYPVLPAGMIVPFAGDALPNGWHWCHGGELNRTTYQRLFQAIGVAYGPGDSATTFNLPDLRGRFPRGRNDGGTAPLNVPNEDRGTVGGIANTVLAEGNMPPHKHITKGYMGDGSSWVEGQNISENQRNIVDHRTSGPVGVGEKISSDGPQGGHEHSTFANGRDKFDLYEIDTTEEGDSEAFANTPPCQNVNYIIKD
jgi:microcystin-dependent protein